MSVVFGMTAPTRRRNGLTIRLRARRAVCASALGLVGGLVTAGCDDGNADPASPTTSDAAEPTSEFPAAMSTTVTSTHAVAPTTTTNEYIDSYHFDGGVPVISNVFTPELFDTDDPACLDALTAGHDFFDGDAELDDLLAAWSAIGLQPGDDIYRYLVDWQEWNDRYGQSYHAALAEISDAGLDDDAAVEAVLATPAYTDALDAMNQMVVPIESITLQTTVKEACLDHAAVTVPEPTTRVNG